MGDRQSSGRGVGLGLLLRPGLIANIGANGLGQLFQALIQLVSVPVYAHSLGLERFGVWLLFATLPAYLAASDFGLTVAAGNDMTTRIARGDPDGARTTFRALARSMVLVALSVGLTIAVLLGWLFPQPLASLAPACGGQPFAVLSLILFYSVALLHCSISFAAFRATGEYSVSSYRLQWITLLEAATAMALALAGLGLVAMAAALAIVRTVGAGRLWLLLRQRQPLFFHGPVESLPARSRSLLRPALAAFALPVSHLLVLQGSVALIGLLAGPAAVPAFAATRTLTRLAVQVGMTVNYASLPEFTFAHARGETARKLDLIGLSGLAALGTLLPAAAVLIPLGAELVGGWTQGRIHAPDSLVLAMVLSMLAHGLWVPVSNFLLAASHQASFSWIYLGVVTAAMGLAVRLVPTGGATAMAWLVAAVDGVMLLVIFWRAAECRVVDRAVAGQLWRRGLSLWRREQGAR